MGIIKEINIKNWTYYFFNDITKIKYFDLSLLQKDQQSYKNINICCIGCIPSKDSYYVKTNSAYPLYLIISEADVSIKEKMEVNI